MKASSLVTFLKTLCIPVKGVFAVIRYLEFLLYGAALFFLSFKTVHIVDAAGNAPGFQAWLTAVTIASFIGGGVLTVLALIKIYESKHGRNSRY